MSVLSSKKILVLGQENTEVKKLEEELVAHGVELDHMTCDQVTAESIEEKAIDLVILNHLDEDEACLKVVTALRAAQMSSTLPVFAYINDVDEQIQKVLSLGAADYITVAESIDSITQKMKTIFGQGLHYTGGSVIDITPTQVPVSKTGLKVYVVEDDPLLRNLLSIRFEKAEFIYKVNGDGKNSLNEISEFGPDVVILDLMLPGRDGFEVLEELKTSQQTKHIPVIVFSNRDGVDDRKRARELGAAGFYVKAMTDLSQLITKIETLVE